MAVDERTPLRKSSERSEYPYSRISTGSPAQIVAFLFGSVFIVAFLVWMSSEPGFQSRIIIVPRDLPKNHPLFCEFAQHASGYVDLPNKLDDHYFYWLFESRNNPSKDPLVLWLAGEPGCSGILALLVENGPCRVKPDLSTVRNSYSWTNNANVIWLDQPTNVGFSHGAPGDEDYNEANVGENVYWFMQGFLKKHPEFDGRDFFITGESYGGHYVPASAHAIWSRMTLNASTDGNSLKSVKLKGIAIGNGLTDPVTQYQHNWDMLNNSYNITLFSANEAEVMKQDLEQCTKLLVTCQTNSSACIEAFMYCGSHVTLPFMQTGRNPYDIRLQCEEREPERCYDFSYIRDYLNAERVHEYLHVQTDRVETWETCNMQVKMQFTIAGDPLKSVISYVKELLENNVRVLIYAGDADLMCNWYGIQAWTNALDWSGKKTFNAAPEHSFITNDLLKKKSINAGMAKSNGKLTFVRVYNAGHLVPKDQPAVALDMINRFLKNETF